MHCARWLVASLLTLAPPALAETAEGEDGTAPVAGAPAPPAKDEGAPPGGENARPPHDAVDDRLEEPIPPKEPGLGDEVGGWVLVAFRSEKRLPDGRPTLEPCGYIVDVVAERGPRVERALLAVPCVRGPAGLVRGAARLLFPDPTPPPATTNEKPPATTSAEAPASPKVAPEEAEGAAPMAATGEGEGETHKDPPEAPFLKGELTELGIVQLMNQRTSFGVALGAAGIDNVYYAVVTPNLNLRFGDFNLGLGAPLRFQVVDMNRFENTLDPASYRAIFEDAGSFRLEDWDQVEDWLRPLRYLTWGKKEDNLYFDLNRAHSLTIGHGQLMRRYSPNIDIDEDNLFAELDAYADFGGVELIAGPLPVPRIAGGLVFVKPLGLFLDDYLSKSLSIGLSYLTDLNTPTALPRVADDGGRERFAVDPSGSLYFPQLGALVGDRVQGLGVDAEIKLVKWEFIDLKTYVDYSHLILPGVPGVAEQGFADGGFTAGALLRMSFGQKPARDLDDEPPEVQAGEAPREMMAAHAVRLRLEGRTFGPRYLPSYFDTLYEADKLQFGFGDPNVARNTLPTKIGWLASQEGEPWRIGHYLELSYVWVDLIGLTVMYEDAFALGTFENVAAARNLAFHAETFGLGWVQLFATYHYRHFEDFSRLFQFSTDNEVFYLGGRVALLPILYVNFGLQRAFGASFAKDIDDPDLRAPLPGQNDSAGLYRYSSLGLANTWAGTLEVELGWQF